jgi:hypothetical protein
MRARAGTVLVAAVLAAGCAASGHDTTTAPTSMPPVRTSDASFCRAWQDAFASRKEDAARAALRDAPNQIAAAAELVRTADWNATNPTTDAALKRIRDWVTVNCVNGSGRHAA